MAANLKQLNRSRDDRMIAGVCGGLGEYLNIDPTIVRLIFVFGSIVTSSGLFWAYLVMMLIVPEEPLSSEAIVDAPVEDMPDEE